MAPKVYTKEQGLDKAKHYCAYQERCHSEVKSKLYEWGLHPKEVDWVISALIEENYLNEERFAIHFAGGKFRVKNWGRVKIKFELKQRQVSEYCIRKALQQIDEEDYYSTLHRLADEKLLSLHQEKNKLMLQKKLVDYLKQKGFETSLILQEIKIK